MSLWSDISKAWTNNVTDKVSDLGDALQREVYNPVKEYWKEMDTEMVQGGTKLAAAWLCNFIPVVGTVASVALTTAAKEDFMDAAGKGVTAFAKNQAQEQYKEQLEASGQPIPPTTTLSQESIGRVMQLFSAAGQPASLTVDSAYQYADLLRQGLASGMVTREEFKTFKGDFLAEPQTYEEKFMKAAMKLALVNDPQKLIALQSDKVINFEASPATQIKAA